MVTAATFAGIRADARLVAVMREQHEHEQHASGERRHGEEVHRDHGRDVIRDGMHAINSLGGVTVVDGLRVEGRWGPAAWSG